MTQIITKLSETDLAFIIVLIVGVTGYVVYALGKAVCRTVVRVTELRHPESVKAEPTIAELIDPA